MVDRTQLATWMAAAAEGDRTALDPLFAALWPIVCRYTARLLGDAALAEDAAQDALIALFGRLDRYDRERDALTWALAHATWAARTHRRRRQRRAEDTLAAAPEPTATPAIEDRELVRAAVATLAELAPRDVEIITASLVDDDELRATLAPATFRKRLERALARLRHAWRSRHGNA
jgi:RNA polymerase sigma-70 factor (ECF subfamily)|nr:sigma-70 family RNA polymerase sigma factor [Kofleriaceae bacterium]